ncbi:RidA family protein [Tessaracoccus sp. OS52]|uniref:RidA family protein n=1 Tax=Tessaracoccus sp. OS52 TaxID=2886691 RepID=UPI001D10221A|nr:RidA family protein [Tessaracoccus sp. OS52]MCC2594375.1 RidA family protein [Tessaracoccus sp. OS52]
MLSPAERLAEMGLALPEVAAPIASYVPARISGNLAWTSGQLPLVDGGLLATGKLGMEVGLDDGVAAARAAVLNALAAVSDKLGGINQISSIHRVVVYVASTPDFTDQAKVANGASDLLVDVFGPGKGSHVRSAVGVAVLPLDAPVEVELMVEI